MNTGIVNIILVLKALLLLSGCATAPAHKADLATDRPILSAAEVNSMIRVEYRALEAASPEQTIVASVE